MLPNLVIIGAMKAGTTSLHGYLDRHPDISMSNPKELNFFSNPKYWRKGVAWYQRHFQSNAKIRGESSTSYTVYPLSPEVPERMHAMLPDARLIYIVRDPIKRLVSHYVHALAGGEERRNFKQAVQAIGNGEQSCYIDRGLYFRQLQRFLKFYKPEQILVITSESLRRQREKTLERVCEFLDLPYRFSQDDLAREQNSGELWHTRTRWSELVFPGWLMDHPRIPWQVKSPFYHLAKIGAPVIARPEVEEADAAELKGLFRGDVQELRDFTGEEFPEWATY